MARHPLLQMWRLFVLTVSLLATYNANSNVHNLSTTQDNRQATTQSSVDAVLTTTSSGTVNNELTTNSEDVENTFTTGIEGLNNKRTTTHSSVDAVETTISPGNVNDGSTITSEDVASTLTTGIEGLDNKRTTTLSSVEDTMTTTLDNVTNKITTTSNMAEDEIKQTYDTSSVLELTLVILGVPHTLIPGKNTLSIDCEMEANIDIMHEYSLALYRKPSEVLMEKILSVVKMKNNSVISWADKKLLARSSRLDTNCRNTYCRIFMRIDRHDTLCEDAAQYVCTLSALTNTGPVTAITVSKENTRIDPPVPPYYTDEIEVNDPGHVNSDFQHEYPVFTLLTFRCSGSIGSDRLTHKWHVAVLDDPCSTEYRMTSRKNNHVSRDSCNNIGVSTADLNVPDVTEPIVVWCWVSYAETVQEECAKLTESNLVKSFTILPVWPDEVEEKEERCIGSTLRSFILKPEKTTYRQDEPLEITCRFNSTQEQGWYYHRVPPEPWGALPYKREESNGWQTITLSLPKLSLSNRGWYACMLKEDCNYNEDITNENQTLFVDVLYEPCRENGVMIAGDACLEVMSASSCAANNGTIASIHTGHKSRMLYDFAFYVLVIQAEVIIGLSLTGNTMLWEHFVWTDGTPLTFMERLDSRCLVCFDNYPVAIAMKYRGSLGDIGWVKSVNDVYVACEWKVERRYTGLSVPPSIGDYTGSKSMFQCTSGEYISAVYSCDGTFDCSDVSDELNCDRGCVGASFQCDYGGCISASKSCDFIKDCADGSDEILCNYPICDDGYWQCANKECIPVYDVCDGHVECVDGSDEADVLCIANSVPPTEYTFRCFEPDRILPLSRRCDSFTDCKINSDELCSTMTYHSCSSWADITTVDIEPEVGVDYGMFQYGPVTVQCSMDENEVHTTWEFSLDQDTPLSYTASAVSNVLWFKTAWNRWQFQAIFYKSHYQQNAMVASSSSCVQYIRACGYYIYASGLVIEWKSGNGDIHSMYLEDNFGCYGFCTHVGCTVQFEYKDSLQDDTHSAGNEDFGWIPITDKLQLPVTSMRSNYLSVVGISRLICSDGLHSNETKSTISYLQCLNGINYDPALQCLMNFDPTGDPIACRDLTHLENCEHFSCPEEYAKCPESFCLHMRYVCDGTGHCPHNEDELDCESTNCTNHYRCRGGQPCVPFTHLCDGERHCPLGDDEHLCDETCPRQCTCQGLTFVCDSGKDEVHLRNITSKARWISMKDDMRNLANHFPLSFPLLTTLILESCSIEELIVHGQSVFKNITALRHLDISLNQIQSLPDGIFSDIMNLRTLILSHNPLVSISGGVFIGLKALKNLYISDSNIRELTSESKVFSELPSLENLDLSSNLISRLPRNIFSKLKSLQTLTLSDNPLALIDVDAFSRLYFLSNLQLSHINSERIISGAFNGLQALTSLNLSSSAIQHLGLRSFQELGNLVNLDIQNNHFEVDEFMFDGLEHLQYLYADTYKMCCIKPKSVRDENCFAPKDLISSCSNLIGSNFLRVFLWVIGLSALVGNIFVIIYRLVIDNVNLKKSQSIFVINLSISDFIMGIYMIIIASVDINFSGRYVVNDLNWRQGPLCIAAGCLSVISSEMSTFAIFMITVDRFIAIAFPLSLRKITWRTAVLVSVLLWVLSLILAIIPQALFPSYFKGEFYARSGVCLALPLTGRQVPGQEYSVAIFIGLNGLLFLVILIGQLCIHRICKGSGSIATTKNRKQEIALARSLFLVVATDFLCWFPIGLLGVWSRMGGAVSADVYAWVMVFVLPINSALNPLLYTYIYIKRKREISVAHKQAKPVSKGKLSMTDGFSTSNSLKEVHFCPLFTQRKDYVCLEKYARDRKVSPAQAYQIAVRIMKAVSFLHCRNAIHGNVSDKNVCISNKVQVFTRAILLLDQSPIGGDQDSHTDILQYGLTVKTLLRMLDRH